MTMSCGGTGISYRNLGEVTRVVREGRLGEQGNGNEVGGGQKTFTNNVKVMGEVVSVCTHYLL